MPSNATTKYFHNPKKEKVKIECHNPKTPSKFVQKHHPENHNLGDIDT